VPYQLTIHKAAAPWFSVPAYAAYAILGVALILWAARAQRAKLRTARAAQLELESEVALRTKELREANRQLIIASEAKSDFLARMGHELRTPMNGVVGMTELIGRSPLSVTQARQLQTIRTSAQTLLQILNDLLDLSKAQAGKTVLESLPLDINLLIEECVAMFTGAAESKGIDLIVCPALPGRLEPMGDALRIRQLLMNLVGNAVKFTERGEVVVTCDLEAAGAELVQMKIAVADTGVGISAAALEKIFEPFTQADETTTRRFGGTGLGLSICHQLTKLMGGEISVQSEPGKGSTFTITVQLKAQANVLSGRPAMIEGTALLLSERPTLRESLRRHAALLGLKSRHAALDSAFATDEFDVVMLDADSHPAEVDRFMIEALRTRTIIVAAPGTIEAQRLEAQVANHMLLRNPIQRDAFSQAVMAARDMIQGSTSSDGKSEPADIAGTFQFPLIPAHVLIVEDDEVNGTVAEGYLTMLGCSSVWLKDGLSAVARCEAERFDVILMDLNMPGLDGYETTRRIRSLETGVTRTPIIALTANKASAHREACLLAGMDDILSKPYSLAQLTGLLRHWVDASETLSRSAIPQGAPRDLTLLDGAGMAEIGSLGAGNDLFARLVELFEGGSVKALARIDSALRAQDWKTAQQAAHKLKGAAGNIGAHQFAAQLAELEASCNDDGAALAHHSNRMLRAALPALLASLKQHCLRQSA
jgi:signal transduction histidine kinase/CheY-like chemotaxis protein